MFKMKGVIAVLLLCIFIVSGCSTRSSLNGGQDGGDSNGTPLKFTMSITSGATPYVLQSPNINEDKWVKELEKRTNTDIHFIIIDNAQFTQQMNLMFASGDIPDVVQANKPWESSLAGSVEAGVFTSLDNYINDTNEFPNFKKVIPEKAWTEMRSEHDMKIYAVPEFLSTPARRATFIRKDLLEKYNLDVPITVDDFVHVMTVFKQNGLKFPYAGRTDWGYTDTFFAPFDAHPSTWTLTEKNELVPTIITPQMKEALAFHRMLNEKGLMDPESLTTGISDWNNKIINGDVGIFCHNITGIETWNSRIQQNIPNAEWMMIASPRSNDGKKGGLWNYPTTLRGYYINKNFKETERLLKFFDWQLSEEAAEFFAFGIKDEDYKVENGEYIFTYPTETKDINEVEYRSVWLNLTNDKTYNKHLLPFMPGGNEIIKFYEEIAPNDGFSFFDPGLFDALLDYSQLGPRSPDLWRTYAAKIFFGQEPIDSFDLFVDEFYKRGGNEIVKQATERYNKGLGIMR